MSAVRRNLPLLSTAAIFCVLFGLASFFYPGFLSARVATSLLSDNAFLGIAALGMTLVRSFAVMPNRAGVFEVKVILRSDGGKQSVISSIEVAPKI